MRNNQHRHHLGDVVRLYRGWTPMTVIGFTPDDEVIAQYGTCPSLDDVTYPMAAQSTYTRPHYGFVEWNGKPQHTKFPEGLKKMAKRYQPIGSSMTGTFMNVTSQGHIALEFDDGTVGAFEPHRLAEIVRFTFKTKAILNNNTIANWAFADGTKRVNVGDLLFSNTDGFIRVTETDTRHSQARNFDGQRFVMEEI